MKLFFIFVFLLPCFLLCAKPKREAQDNGYRVIGEFTRIKKNELGCLGYGIGGGFLGNVINDLNLDLAFRRELSVAEARELYVNLLVDFIDFIAGDQRIRTYLLHYPPLAKEVQLGLTFLQKEGWKPTPMGTVSLMGVGKGSILYFSTHDGNHKIGYQDLHSELLLGAIEIVRKAGKLHWYPWLDEWLAREKGLLEPGS